MNGLHLSTRPPLTDYEADLVLEFRDALTASETFYITGEVDVGVTHPMIMYALEGMDTKAVSLRNSSTPTLDALHDHCTPSHFGKGKELVKDESYRLAKELKADKFGLNFDPIAHRTGIAAAISAFVKKGVDIRMYKLNSYAKDGHFKAHQDTPKAINHIGTLLVELPAPYTGGELILRHAGETVTINWSRTPNDSFTSRFKWVFLYSDVEHEILPVTSGNRLTLAYDVYTSKNIQYKFPLPLQAPVDIKSTALYAKLSAMLADADFLPDGGELAVGLAYEYPVKDVSNSGARFNALYKGSDHALWSAILAAGLKATVRAVYEPLEFPYERQKDEHEEDLYEVDGFSSLQGDDEIIITSEYFGGIDSNELFGFEDRDDKVDFFVRCTEGLIDWDLIWVRYPKKYVYASSFSSYGNEPSTDHCYVAGAVIVFIPAAGEGVRKVESD